ncbi:hypothetical protein [Cellulomonas sp. PhB150]|uniref:hypothetical protein n=1 Tax=Cellulomonas sp. PhB150 TaxID=2485188 RepID=UPI000F482E29|nr:hypothetical protein [Cellulomonas sp. PhB150]ROS25789.1 hypothetical protein EDF34_2110 [Cellulomonas sp. PhB150]
MPDGQDWDASWRGALDALELDVAWVEEALRAAHLPAADEVARLAAWVPPTGLGPLPADLVVRATALLDRQTQVARATIEAITRSRRHVAALDALRPHRGDVAVYVDTQA